jgi:lactose/L-arabinose transport system ATP-binding protein
VLRSGKIEQVGAPLDLYDNPDNIFVAGFMGAPKMNFMEAEVENADGGGAQFNIPIFGNKKVSLPVASARKGQKVKLGVRPEHFVQGGLGRAATDVDMHIELLEQLGGDSYAYARINGSDLITVEAENGRALKTGGSIRVALNPEKVLAFDDGGLRLR